MDCNKPAHWPVVTSAHFTRGDGPSVRTDLPAMTNVKAKRVRDMPFTPVPLTFMFPIRDLESLAAEAWQDDARSFVDEAIRCHRAGAQRAAVVTTWTAVCVDVLGKLRHLAEDGTAEALAVLDLLEHEDAKQQARAFQQFESSLVKTALELDLIDQSGATTLTRLKEDRHRCAHPSLSSSGYFRPSPEQVRAHIVDALEALMSAGPIQGHKALDRFQQFVTDYNSSFEPEFLRANYWHVAAISTRRRIVDLAAKLTCGVLDEQLDLSTRLTASKALEVFANEDRALTIEALRKAAKRLAALPDPKRQIGGIAVVGNHADFWDVIDNSFAVHINSLVTNPDFDTQDLLPLALVPSAAKVLDDISSVFGDATVIGRATAVLGSQPPGLAVALVPAILEEARNFREAEQVCRDAVLTTSHAFVLQDLTRVLEAWASNDQCLNASDMVRYAVQLFDNTQHLLPTSLRDWETFLTKTPETDLASHYSYPELRDRVASHI